MAQAPPANVVTGEDRSGSPARSRGTCQRAPGPPSGSATRNEITARPGSAAKRLATCVPSWGSGNHPSSSRNSTTSPPHASTPALRHPAHVGAVPDDDHLKIGVLLCDRTLNRPAKLRRPVPHRQDHAGEFHPLN